MPILSNSRKAQLEFFEAHIARWQANSSQIGIDPLALPNFATLIQDAREALTVAETSRIASRDATLVYYEAIRIMVEQGREFLKMIKLEADVSDNINVYALAGIPAPRQPKERKGTPAPVNLKAVLDTAGTIDLTWGVPSKDAFAGKTFYIIQRRLTRSTTGQPDENWATYNTSNERSFTDTAVPVGWTGISYRIATNRNGFISDPSTEATVTFGTLGQLPGENNNATRTPAAEAA